ncbi:helix-hairpin-helix domain-containing protein [Nitratifractor sp.]
MEVAEAGAETPKAEKKPAKKAAKKESPAKKETPAETAAKAAAKEAAKATEKKGDDLTKIKGIGKAYQQKLNDEGIYTYEDVANMSEEQIAMMEEKYSFKGDFKESVADAKNILNSKEA